MQMFFFMKWIIVFIVIFDVSKSLSVYQSQEIQS